MLEFQLLGDPLFKIDNRPVMIDFSDREIALIAYVACQPSPKTRTQIGELMWSGRTPKQARSNLRTFLTRHREHLDPFLNISRDRISLKSAENWVDVAEFSNRLQSAERHKNRESKLSEQTAERFQKVVRLYQGPFLAGINLNEETGIVEWIDQERDRFEEHINQARHYLIRYSICSEQYEKGLQMCQELLAKDRFNETVQGYFIQCLAQTESPQSVQAYFVQYTEQLHLDFKVAPGAELSQLVDQLVEGEQTLSNYVSAKLPKQPSAANTPTSPLPTRPLIGRQRETQLIKRYLAQSARRLVTIVGVGGIGKTHLTLHVAEELADEFIDGVLFLPLADQPTTEQTDLTHERNAPETLIAGALNLTLNGRRETGEQLFSYLRERDMLIIIDNAESDLAEIGRFAQALLEQVPHIKLLVTSRAPLNVRAESIIMLENLPIPTHTESTSVLSCLKDASFDSVRLFISCANLIFHRFEATDQNLPHIIRICQLVSGIPLAIELAAAWIGHYTCAEIVEAIEKDIHFLHTRFLDHPERHNDITSVFNHSWQLLNEDEQSALLQLSSFAGTFSRDAAERIIDGPVQTLVSLVDKSMLHLSHSGRYEMHDLVRRFVSEKWHDLHGSKESLVRQATQYRFGSYYLNLIAELASNLHVADPGPIIQTIQSEMGNIHKAWYLMIEAGHYGAVANAVNGLSRFYHFAGLYHEALALYTKTAETLEAISLEKQDQNRAVFFGTKARVQAKASFYHNRLRQFTQALKLSEKTLENARQADDHIARTEGLLNLGEAWEYENRTEIAEQNYFDALTSARQVNEKRLEAVALRLLGRLAWRREEMDEADRFYWQALAIERKRGDLLAEVQLVVALALNAELRGNLSLTESYFEEAMENCLKLSNSHRLNEVRLHLGRVRFMRGQNEIARELFDDVLRLAKEIGEWRSEGECWRNLAHIALQEGRLDQALLYADKSLRLARQHEDAHYLASSLATLGTVYQHKGLINEADRVLQEALDLSERLEAKGNISRLLIGRSLCAIDSDKLKVALQLAQDALTKSKGIIAQTHALAHLGLVMSIDQQYAQSIEADKKALTLTRQIGYPHLEKIVIERLAQSYKKVGQDNLAEQLFGQIRQLKQG